MESTRALTQAQQLAVDTSLQSVDCMTHVLEFGATCFRDRVGPLSHTLQSMSYDVHITGRLATQTRVRGAGLLRGAPQPVGRALL